MSFMPFDALAYAKKLEKGSVKRKQAWAMTCALLEALD